MKRFVQALAKALGKENSQQTLESWQKKLEDSILNQGEAMKKAQEIIINASNQGLSLRQIAALTGLKASTVGRIVKESKKPACLTKEPTKE